MTRVAAAVSALLIISGCGQSQRVPAEPEALYLDLVAVARALGRDELMSQQVAAAREQLNAQLREITSELNQELELERSRLGEEPAEEEQRKLESLAASANLQLQQTQLLARQKFADFRQGLVDRFQQDVTAAARPLARERGARRIAVIDGNTLWLDPAVDITDEVIAVMRASSTVPARSDTPQTVTDPEVEEELHRLNDLVDELSSEPGSRQ